MRKTAFVMIAVAMVAAFGMAQRGGPNEAAAVQGSGPIPGQYIVVLDDGADAAAIAAAAGGKHGVKIDHVYTSVFQGYAFHGNSSAARAIALEAGVRSVSQDVAVTALDGGVGGQASGSGSSGGTLVQPAQSVPTGLRRIGWSTTLAAKGTGVGVAVIDTGVQLDHPDLQGGAVSGTNCVRPGRPPNDDNGHGTHVAGTIGARDNTIGVVGVAPQTTIYAVKVLNAAGSGSWAEVICGIDWVTANAAAKNIKVVNMSLGGPGVATPSDVNCGNTNADALHTAICRSVKAGITYVVAAGNSASNAVGFVPAAYDEVIAVSALADFDGTAGGGAAATCRLDDDDTFADFSNFGAVVDLAAPGVCITSTWLKGGYNTISGTSMASPHVAGAAALYIGATADTPTPPTPAAVKLALQAASEPGPIAGDPDGINEGLVHVQ